MRGVQEVDQWGCGGSGARSPSVEAGADHLGSRLGGQTRGSDWDSCRAATG